MGIDVVIYFRSDGAPDLEESLPKDFTVRSGRPESHPDATHMIDTTARYYGPGYERGPWPDICAVLMLLHACPQVSTVWYGGDSSDDQPVFTPEDVVRLSLWYMEHGNRPYHRLSELGW
jgi:hypothetical protein